MWFLMSFFSYVSSTIAGAVARLEKGKKRRQEFVEGHSQGVWLCLFLRRSDTSRGGPQRKPPKKKGGRAGSNTHIHTLFSFKMCACQCLSCRYSVEIFDILSWFADTVGTCRLYKTEVWLPIFLHALDPSNSQKYPGKGTSFPDLMGSGLGGPSPEETYKVWRQCFTCNDLSLSWVLN